MTRDISQSEEKRKQQEDEILKLLFAFKDMSEPKWKVVSTLTRKTDKMNDDAMHNEVMWLIHNKVQS